MTKVEINGKTYCVETLIYTVERLTNDVKASAEYHRLVLEKIRDEIVEEQSNWREDADAEWHECRRILRIIDKYTAERR